MTGRGRVLAGRVSVVLSLVVAWAACDDDSSGAGGGGGATTTSSTGATGGSGTGGGAAGSGTGGSAAGNPTAMPEGSVRYIHHTGSSDDGFLSDMEQWASWYADHHFRMVVFSPFFDDKLQWYPDGWDYFDLYAIYAGSQLLTDHPEWVLRDGNGTMLFIPWGCSGGTCPQYAGDISSAAFRAWWIDEAKTLVQTKGYRGLWIDDVNFDFRVSDGNGDFVAPIDPHTLAEMTESDWRRYMAEFAELIRAELPNAEICHNSIWYAGGSERHQNVFVQRQIAAADYVTIEHGFIDGGITGGTGAFSLEALHGYIDDVHGMSRKVLLYGDTNDPAMLEYSLSNYFLVNDGQDALGHHDDASPTNWWPGHDVELGAALGPRQTWNGLRRRDFDRGLVLVNEPDAGEATVDLPGTYVTLDGTPVTSVTLGPKSGAVLQAPSD